MSADRERLLVMERRTDQSNPDGSSPLHDRRRELLAAIADPIRLEILRRSRREKTVSELCAELEMAQPRISHHLAVLRRTGLLVSFARGREHPHRWSEAPPGSDLRRVQDLLRAWFDVPAEKAVRAESAGAKNLEDFLL